jgi:hypothetical protein
MAEPTATAALAHVIALIESTDQALDRMTPEQYRATGLVGHGSAIGAHIRHCLDHVQALVDGMAAGVIDYDSRIRGTDVESSPAAAHAAAARAVSGLRALAQRPFDEAVVSLCMLAADAAPMRLNSTFGRELAFVLSHTVHHTAMVVLLARAQGIDLPERFGYAPSTVAWLESGQGN